MANHCWNWVCFEGDKDALTKLKNKVEESTKTTEYFNEQAEIVLGKSYLEENTSIYDVYGTRWWEIDNIEESEDGCSLIVSGSSAWSPPCEYVRLISELYGLNATIEFEEMGNDFGGREVYESGEVTSAESMTYSEWIYNEDAGYAVERFLEDLEDNLEFYKTSRDLLKEIEHMSDEHKKEVLDEYKRLKECTE